MRTMILILAAVFAATIALGCATYVPEGDLERQTSFLAADGATLDIVPRDQWRNAPSGCEGRLDPSGQEFSLASDAGAALLVVVGIDGRIVCVDSADAIETELRDIGEHDQAEDLENARQASLKAGPGPGDGCAGSDPYPQPSMPTGSDPYPQPSMPTGSDPYPQPSMPTGSDPYPQPSQPEAPKPNPRFEEMREQIAQ